MMIGNRSLGLFGAILIEPNQTTNIKSGLLFLGASFSMAALQTAQAEWEEVDKNGPPQIRGVPESSIAPLKPIAYSDALKHLLSLDFTTIKTQITVVAEPQKEPSGGCFGCFKKPPPAPVELNEELKPDRDQFFCIAKVQLRDHPTNYRILQTVYHFLLNKSPNEPLCSENGEHWETIGFQGIDPGTDLRGVGMLGALHMVYCAV